MFDLIEYESPPFKLIGEGDGKFDYRNGYGYYYCNEFNPNIGHGDGYYLYVKDNKEFYKYNVDLIFKL